MMPSSRNSLSTAVPKGQGRCGRNRKALTAVSCGRKTDRNSYGRTLKLEIGARMASSVYTTAYCVMVTFNVRMDPMSNPLFVIFAQENMDGL